MRSISSDRSRYDWTWTRWSISRHWQRTAAFRTQTLINLYLRECATSRKKLVFR